MAIMISFDRTEREIAALLWEAKDPKVIAGALEIAVSTAYRRIDEMCERAQVNGRHELLLYILQNPECLLRGEKTPAGLHEQPCECGSPYCLGGIMLLRRKIAA